MTSGKVVEVNETNFFVESEGVFADHGDSEFGISCEWNCCRNGHRKIQVPRDSCRGARCLECSCVFSRLVIKLFDQIQVLSTLELGDVAMPCVL